MDRDVSEELRINHGPGLPGVGRRQQSWWRRPRALVLVLVMASLGLLLGGCGSGARTGALPSVRVQVGGPEGGDSMSVGVQLLLLLTVLSLVPAILMMVTSFIRIAIVLSFARSAIGMQQMPPNQILFGLSLFLTVFVMAPIWTTINEAALQP
jgi:flagellar biosynthetic protein FliP